MKRNTVAASGVLLLIAASALYFFLGPPLLASYKYSSISPDGRHKVDVYSNANLPIAMPGQGGAGSRFATIILRNSVGWRIGSSHACKLFMDDVKIEWGSDGASVDIAKAKSISTTNGICVE
jgi:hypothetical protein